MICPECKMEFISNGHNRKYCSEYCRVYFAQNKSKQEKIRRRKKSKCIHCGKTFFKKTPSHSFCSSACQAGKRNRLRLAKPLVREYFLEKANFTCEECGVDNNDNLEIHHIMPLYRGGSDTIDNLIVLCSRCHKQKHNIL